MVRSDTSLLGAMHQNASRTCESFNGPGSATRFRSEVHSFTPRKTQPNCGILAAGLLSIEGALCSNPSAIKCHQVELTISVKCRTRAQSCDSLSLPDTQSIDENEYFYFEVKNKNITDSKSIGMGKTPLR